MGTLFLVATPIGNLEDITFRAVDILQKAALIAAEDTRRTRKLLNRYKIHTPLISYHEHNKLTRLDQVLSTLAEGDVALVSDAGTPALNDPGYELVRAALQAGFPVSPIPGPSAPLAALIASGLPTDTFLYLGYLPRKSSERLTLLREVAGLAHTLIFLETPHRLESALADLLQVLGDRQIAVARELTKLHEEIFRGSLSQARDHYQSQPPRGEITLVVAGSGPRPVWTEAELDTAIQTAVQSGISPSQAATQIAAESGWPRRKIYRRLTGQPAEDELPREDQPPA